MFDLSAPMKGCLLNQGRYLFLEGDMKYKDNSSKVGNGKTSSSISQRTIKIIFCFNFGKNSQRIIDFSRLLSFFLSYSRFPLSTDGCSLFSVNRYFVGL